MSFVHEHKNMLKHYLINKRTGFSVEIVKVDPQFLYSTHDMGRTIFFHAVLHRQAKLFSLIYSIDDQKLIANALDASTSILSYTWLGC